MAALNTTLYTHDGLHTEIYDALIPGDRESLFHDTSFVIRHAHEVGGPVLELASGTGRVAWPVAEAGFAVVGVDSSSQMNARARAKATRYSPEICERVAFIDASMTEFALSQQFGLVAIVFRSFQLLLSVDAQRRCLQLCMKHLRRDGRLIINIFDPRLEWCLPRKSTAPAERMECVHPQTRNRVVAEAVERLNDPLTQRYDTCWRFTETDADGAVIRREEEILSRRWIYRYEMRHLLEREGFEILGEWSDFYESPPMYGREQVWVARKP